MSQRNTDVTEENAIACSQTFLTFKTDVNVFIQLTSHISGPCKNIKTRNCCVSESAIVSGFGDLTVAEKFNSDAFRFHHHFAGHNK